MSLRGPRTALAVAAAAVMVSMTVPWMAAADTPPSLAGTAGVDTSLALTDSKVTLSGRGNFSNLSVTVNQTKNLLNQAVSVTWTGGAPSVYSGVLGGGSLLHNFLQVFQCWGDDDGTNSANPGPPPENCQFGGTDSNPAARGNSFQQGSYTKSRVVGASNFPTPPSGFGPDTSGFFWMPFHGVDGTAINVQADFANRLNQTGAYWLNPFYDFSTTNEVDIAQTHPDGTGAELFPLDTGLEAPGLGCGQKTQPVSDGSKKIPKCWLVIVPRGNAAQENDPSKTTFSGTDNEPVDTSPLYPTAWANRIAVPLDFSPVDSPCAIGADERRIVGSELATGAVTSWQPKLCGTPGSPPYNYASISDDQARQQLASGAAGGPGMAVVSRPLSEDQSDSTNPVVYAPLTLSGVTIGFNIERTPNGDAEDAEKSLRGIRVARINLTPRLVAKLLTESYQSQISALNLISGGTAPAGYQWILANPRDLSADQDFLQFNPEFKNLHSGQPNAGELVVEQPKSDAAYELWRWVLADPEASAWLAGTADPWGMNVNPRYSTSSTLNPSGAFGNPTPDSYPKSDPYCYQVTELLQITGKPPRPLCILDASPYVNNMQVAAQVTRLANDGAKTTFDFSAISIDKAFIGRGPQSVNNRFILSVTDSASAVRYGLQAAGLSRAGDDGAARQFVVPDQAGLIAGAKAMVPSPNPDVLQPKPDSTAAGTYPLTMLTYAAVAPRSVSPAFRGDYADFVTYAVGRGQTPGLAFGDLPPGYAPLPAALLQQATSSAGLIRSGDPEAVSSTTTTTSQPTVGHTAGNNGGSGNTSSAGGASSSSPTTALGTVPPTGNIALAKPPARSKTPSVGLGVIRYTFPLLLMVGLAAAFVIPLLSKGARPAVQSHQKPAEVSRVDNGS